MASMTVAAAFSRAFAPRRRASTRARSRFARPRAVASSSIQRFPRRRRARSHGEWGADGIAQNSSSMAAMRQAWEAARSTRGADTATMNEAAGPAIVKPGPRHRRDALGEVYRDPDAIEAMCATIERFLPGVRAGEVFHKCPECAVTCAVLHPRIAGVGARSGNRAARSGGGRAASGGASAESVDHDAR